MAIRVQHQGAGAGAGIDDGFKRKYDMRIRQQEKAQDRMFQIGLQNRNVALQRENMIIGDNLQANQRRIARQDAQADLKEDRKFQAERDAANFDRQRNLARVAAVEGRLNKAKERELDQLDREHQFGLQNQEWDRRNALTADEKRKQDERTRRLNLAIFTSDLRTGLEMGEFDPSTAKLIQKGLADLEAVEEAQGPDEVQRESAIAQAHARLLRIAQRRRDTVPQPQMNAEQQFRDNPEIGQKFLEMAIKEASASEDPAAMKNVGKRARELYDQLYGVEGQGASAQGQMPAAGSGVMPPTVTAQAASPATGQQPAPKMDAIIPPPPVPGQPRSAEPMGQPGSSAPAQATEVPGQFAYGQSSNQDNRLIGGRPVSDLTSQWGQFVDELTKAATSHARQDKTLPPELERRQLPPQNQPPIKWDPRFDAFPDAPPIEWGDGKFVNQHSRQKTNSMSPRMQEIKKHYDTLSPDAQNMFRHAMGINEQMRNSAIARLKQEGKDGGLFGGGPANPDHQQKLYGVGGGAETVQEFFNKTPSTQASTPQAPLPRAASLNWAGLASETDPVKLKRLRNAEAAYNSAVDDTAKNAIALLLTAQPPAVQARAAKILKDKYGIVLSEVMSRQ